MNPYYGTGKLFAPTIREKGMIPYAVHTNAEVPEAARSTFIPDNFDNSFHNSEDTETLIAEIQAAIARIPNARVVGVITPNEGGVGLQDLLSKRFNVPGNDPATSAWRNNKGASEERLQKMGIRTAKSLATASLEEAKAWAHEHNKWPIIIKPPISSGSDGVFSCNSMAEIEDAFKEIFGQKNLIGVVNQTVLLQEFIRGPQFAINSINYIDAVTGEQKRIITEIFNQVRGNQFPTSVYETNFLFPKDDLNKALVEYNMAVLNALEHNVGAAHFEVILTETGPVAIDFNPRLPGAGMPVLAAQAHGLNAIDYAIDAHAGRLHAKAIKAPDDFVVQNAATVYIRTHGNVKMSHRMKNELYKLKEKGFVVKVVFNFEEGADLSESINSDTITAKIEILHPDREILENAVTQIRAWEHSGMFEIRQ